MRRTRISLIILAGVFCFLGFLSVQGGKGRNGSASANVELRNFQVDYLRTIDGLENVSNMCEKVHQNIMKTVPQGAITPSNEVQQQVDYLDVVRNDIGVVYGWRIATGLMIKMGNLVQDKKKFNTYFSQWLGYQLSIINNSLSWHKGADKVYSLNNDVLEVKRQHEDVLSKLSLVLKAENPLSLENLNMQK